MEMMIERGKKQINDFPVYCGFTVDALEPDEGCAGYYRMST